MPRKFSKVNVVFNGFIARAKAEARLTIACLKAGDVPGAWEHYELMKISIDTAVKTIFDTMSEVVE